MSHLDDQQSRQDQQFEQELKSAMRRVDAPERLSVALMNLAEAEERRTAAAKAQPSNKIFTLRRMPVPRLWMGGALAATLMLAVLGGGLVHQHHEQEQARVQAEQQFEESQEITERALAHAREQIQRAGVSLDGQ